MVCESWDEGSGGDDQVGCIAVNAECDRGE
jgi:hypothetical protein